MTTFTPIDLSQLPAPDVVEQIDYELILAERKAYAETIMERFANPHIRHELISIALNSVSKWQVRVLPTVKDYAAKHGKALCKFFVLGARSNVPAGMVVQ